MSDRIMGKSVVIGCILRGFISAGIVIILLLAAALAMTECRLIQHYPEVTGNVCLLIGALLCGYFNAKKVETGKMLNALIGEAGLLAVIIIVGLISSGKFVALSLITDIVIMIFGGFAGVILTNRRKRHRRRRK